MRKLTSIKAVSFFLLALGFTALASCPVAAQSGSFAYAGGSLVDVGVGYNYVRTNLGVGDCGCFGLNGGNGWVAFNLRHSFGIVGEVATQQASNISGTDADLTLTSFLAGPRYRWTGGGRFAPFVQGLVGGAHASGSLAPGNSGIPGSANAFAMIAGGGLDIGLARHFAVRAFEADYYLTRFNNGVNDQQNNLRIGAGLIIRFGGGD